MLIVRDYLISHKGIKRDYNEDNIYANGFLLPENHDDMKSYEVIEAKGKEKIYAIFDGIGGLDNGAKASYLGVTTLHKNKTKPLKQLFKIINSEISKEQNIGTTGSIIRITNDNLEYITVGDSPIYVLSGDNFIKIKEKKDDTNLLDNYLGKDDIVSIIDKMKLHNNDKILLCSDGLCNEMNDIDIEYILSSSDDPKYIGDKLLNYALTNGGRDNISLIVITIKKDYKDILYAIIFALVLLVLTFLII
jgi:protein phosphatase